MVGRELRGAALALRWAIITALREGGAAAGHVVTAGIIVKRLSPYWRCNVTETEWYGLAADMLPRDVLRRELVRRWSDRWAGLLDERVRKAKQPAV